MKQKIFLGVLITSIFLTLFSVNVSASEEESTSSNSSLVEEVEESVEIITPYTLYLVYKNGDTYCLHASLDEKYNNNNSFELNDFTEYYYKEFNSIDEIKVALKDGNLTEYTVLESYQAGWKFAKNYTWCYSSHNITYNGTDFFQQAPLKISSQTGMAVGKMTAQQIVQATLKQKVYLLPFLIASVVGFLAFRKGLGMLFRGLGKA